MEKEVKGEKEEHREEKRVEEKKVQNIIRLGETNLDGTKKVASAILGVKGVSFALGNAISKISGFGERKVGDLSEDELKKLEDIINHPEKYHIPLWLYNRRKDPKTGENKHLSVSQLELTQKLDIGSVKKIKSYKGMRHIMDLPVRGQRTRSSFRKGKVVGVSKKAGARKAAKSGK
ncbi:MAG: 30S ribosomal protein S13 [Candidatus Aenigmarchaeota archaeon]